MEPLAPASGYPVASAPGSVPEPSHTHQEESCCAPPS